MYTMGPAQGLACSAHVFGHRIRVRTCNGLRQCNHSQIAEGIAGNLPSGPEIWLLGFKT